MEETKAIKMKARSHENEAIEAVLNDLVRRVAKGYDYNDLIQLVIDNYEALRTRIAYLEFDLEQKRIQVKA